MPVLDRLRESYRSYRKRKQDVLFGPDINQALSSSLNSETQPGASPAELDRLRSKWGKFLHKVASLEGVEASWGNSVEILEGGSATLASMMNGIESATTRVWVETYIFDDSLEVARKVTDALLRAKERGCDVVVIMDYIGSSTFPWRKELETANIPVVLFNPFPWSHYFDPDIPKSVGPVPFRDHRKILIADNIGFCGSMNIQGEVVIRGSETHPGFYDLNARIEGPAVSHLGNVFRDSLEESGVGISRPPLPVMPVKGDTYVQVLQSNVRKQRRSIQKALASQIKAAEREVRVASSYFMPPGFLKRALLATSHNSTSRCQILVSGTTDFFPVPGDLLAQTHALSRFINRTRTSVSLYSQSHMHAKFTSVDNLFVQLGSYNFDRFSSRRNLESAIGVFDHRVASQVSAIHQRLESESNLATDDGMYFRNPVARFICWVAYTVMKTSGRNVFDGFDAYGHGKVVKKKEWTLLFGRADVVATSLALL